MPLNKKKSAPRRKMVQRKKWARRPTRTLVNRALHPIPQRFITKMKYSQVITTAAVTGSYVMNLNSIFDPDRSGGGHQPYGFDTLASLYNRYRVISCGYRLQVAMGSTSNPIILTAYPANQIVASLSCSEIRENPRVKYVTQSPGSSASTLHGKCYIPSIVGRNKAQYMADDRYQAVVTADPDEVVPLNIQTFNTTDQVVPNTQVQVLLEYTVEFFDVKALGQSQI